MKTYQHDDNYFKITIFGGKCILNFNLAHILSDIFGGSLEEGVNDQGTIHMFLVHFTEALMLSIFLYSQQFEQIL